MWSITTSLPAPRTRPAVAATPDGTIYVFGGTDNSVDYDTTFVYHPRTNMWTQGANVPFAREGAQAVTLPDGRILVVGGGTGCHGTQHCAVYGTAALYTPRTNRWAQAAGLQTPRYRFAAALGHDGRVYALGGWDGSRALYGVEVYTPRTNTWSTAPSLPLALEAPAVATDAHGRIVVLGGYDGNDPATYYSNVFILSGSGWASGAPLPTAREDFGAARGPDGRIYAAGGYNSNGFLSTVEVYTPSTNSWSSAAPLPAKICCLAVVAPPGGRLYVVGGGAPVYMLDLATAAKKSAAEVGTSMSFVALKAGRLGLGVNDGYFLDNSGSWTVTITVQ
jgi:N-acetylneuraminic acid mutarotase